MATPNTAIRSDGWHLDINTGDDVTPVWVPVLGLTDLTPPYPEATEQDVAELSDTPYGAQLVTLLNWSIEASMNRKHQNGVFDPGQQVLFDKSFKVGTGNLAEVRVYQQTATGEPTGDAFSGWATVKLTADSQTKDGIGTFSLAMAGNSELEMIPNPLAA